MHLQVSEDIAGLQFAWEMKAAASATGQHCRFSPASLTAPVDSATEDKPAPSSLQSLGEARRS